MASGHSINIYPDGTIERYRDSKLHHTTGPAVERSDGTKEWYTYGMKHAVGAPATEKF